MRRSAPRRSLHRNDPSSRTLLRAVAIIVVPLALLEGAVALLLANPRWLPSSGFLLDGARSVYLREDWSVPQADLEVVAHDPDLTYMLRPGTARFANREFDTALRANSAGLRDDEASLHRPEVIVLGDSYAMGWGVEQDETFPQVLERRSGMRVLNAAMSSFGTARQAILLERLDTTAARAVVVQYFLNDYKENRAFLDGGYDLDTTPREEFEASARAFERQTRYRPLDYLLTFFDRASFFPELETASSRQVADSCLEILAASGKLEGLPIVFLQIDPWNDGWYNIADAIIALLATAEYSDLRQRMRVVRLRNVLSSEDFFVLDPHLRAAGHEKVAAALARALSDISSALSTNELIPSPDHTLRKPVLAVQTDGRPK